MILEGRLAKQREGGAVGGSKGGEDAGLSWALPSVEVWLLYSVCQAACAFKIVYKHEFCYFGSSKNINMHFSLSKDSA